MGNPPRGDPAEQREQPRNTEASMGNTPDNTDGQLVSTKQARIAMLARQHAGTGVNYLHHEWDIHWMIEAFERTRKDGAPGVDGVTWEAYGENLYANLQSLLDRANSGTYRAPPVKRAFIPKGNGESRPIGIPTLEDRVLQRAVLMLLEPIMEQEFLDCSFGFRKGRSAHDALEQIWRNAASGGMNWVIDLDIRKFFDTLDHCHLREMLGKRVQDGVIRRLIDKWLAAGVMENGRWHAAELGTPQGGVISPMLANLYLHVVLDEWLATVVPPYLKGRVHLVRYADDAVIGCERVEDANMLMRVLPKRLGRFGLTLHPEKTRLVRFNRPKRDGNDSSGQPPESFNFLGFTHYWGKSRSGSRMVIRKTAVDRFRRSLAALWEWGKEVRHTPIQEQHRTLCAKIRGHGAYFGISGNSACLRSFVYRASRTWHFWLGRRGNAVRLTWERFNQLLQAYPLPRLRIVHPFE